MKSNWGALLAAAVVACGPVLAASPAGAITINPIFSPGYDGCFDLCVSLTTIPGAAAAIIAADNQIASQFGGGMTADIVYMGIHAGYNGFLGASSSGWTVYTYSQYAAALATDAATHPSNTVLNTAVANLGSGNGAGDPNALIALNTTAARNLGLTNGVLTAFGPSDQTPEFDSDGNYVGPDAGGVADGVVYLNIDPLLSYTRPVKVVTGFGDLGFDVQTTMEHETDEVLGTGGSGSQLNFFNDDPNYAFDYSGVSGDLYGPLDLYRYSTPGTPSFDPINAYGTICYGAECVDAPSPYFSVDGGATSIQEFNQLFPSMGGDAGDWAVEACPGPFGSGGTGDVQAAFSCINHMADVTPGAPSYLALEAIGYNAVPEPSAWLLMLTGFGGLGVAIRSHRKPPGTAHP